MNEKRKLYSTVGIVLILISTYSIINTALFLSKSNEVIGTVIGFNQIGSASPAYYPVVKFKCCKDHEIEFEGKPGTRPPEYLIGENVKVIFDPSEPENAKIYSFSSIWLLPLSGLGLGLFFVSGVLHK